MLTAEEVFGQAFGWKAAEELLRQMNLTTAMRGLAFLLSRRQGPSGNYAAADAELLPQLPTDLQQRIRRVSDENTVICAEQGILMAMRFALQLCPETGGHDRVDLLVPVILAIQQEFRAPGSSPLRFDGDTSNALFREIVRSHALSLQPDRRSQMAHLEIRWEDLPGQLGRTGTSNPAEAFAEFTGVEVADFSTLAVSFWAQGLNRPGEIITWPAQLDWDDDRKARALALIASDVPKLRRAIAGVAGEAEQWAFDEFRRWPILQLGAGWLVLAPEFVFDRQFGAPPLLDIRAAMTPAQEKARWTHIEQTFQDMCEEDALIGLRNIANNDGATFYSEDDLKRAFGRKGVQIADAAIDAGDRWIVIEISSRKPTRGTIIEGDPAALSKDLDLGIVRSSHKSTRSSPSSSRTSFD
jgi:hypothetical protein